LFYIIGKEYIIEWEKEFGKNEFYLADSFNEMQVPIDENLPEVLRNYGLSNYNPIHDANPDATWVM